MNQWISGMFGIAVVFIPFLTLSETVLTRALVLIGFAIALSSFWGMIVEQFDNRPHGTSHV